MRFEKVWIEQCRATKTIKRRFGAKSALDYLIGEKFVSFADDAREHPEFAKELPRFLAAVWQTFNEYEIAGYIASRKGNVSLATIHRCCPSKAFFQRLSGSSNTTLVGSNASGSCAPPAHSIDDSCSEWAASPIAARNSM